MNTLDPIGFFRLFLRDSAKNLYRLLTDKEYRRYLRLVLRFGRTPRYRQRTMRVGPWTLVVPDVASFLSAFQEIFVERIYEFTSEHDRPVILDCGANIGLSVLFFRRLYPKATIVAYEADPAIFAVLRENLERNGITGVELHNMAVWSSETTLEFSAEGADGGRVNTGADRNIVPVRSIGLSSIISEQSFEFIKLDIEGAEIEALKGCESYLSRSRCWFIEFHSFPRRRQGLGGMIDMFERSGFRVHVHPPFISKRPFLGIRESHGMDMQLNLFFWKDGHGTP